jgi:RNA polymerase sigma-70 factor (ECF subfamily)
MEEEADSRAVDRAMDRYADGDNTAFGEVYQLVKPRLLAFLERRVQDRALAHDLMQQTFLQMHHARGRFCRGAEVMPWAYAIARRLLIDSVRRGEREACLTPPLPAQPERPDELADAGETARRLVAALGALPAAHREAYQLVRVDELSTRQAAEVLGTTTTAVKLRVHRAYVRLRELLDGGCE